MSKWFVKLRHTRAAKLRVFCFPYAGGGASIYRGIEKWLPAEVDVFAVQRPGREDRIGEEPYATMGPIIAALQREMVPYCDVPCIFVGYSLGGMEAFELGRAFQCEGGLGLKHLLVCASRPPHLPSSRPPFHQLPYDEFIETDFALGFTHRCESDVKLKVDSTVFFGVRDVLISADKIRQWDTLLDGRVSYVDFSSGHFFIHEEAEKFREELVKTICGIL
ncbi:MAG: thioesterase domain-containing protein [Exilibacterium sp.]